MKPDLPFDLPYGARGFELEGLAVEFCGDKLLWIDRNRAEHYTMHMGSSSGVFDVHRTWSDADGLHHQTVFAIKLSELPKAMEGLAETSMLQNFLQLYRPLRIGWLKRHGIMLVRGLDIVDNDGMAAITRKRKKRLSMDEDRVRAQIVVSEPSDEVYDFPDGPFSLFTGRRNRVRRIGIRFKHTDPSGKAILHWVKLKDLSRIVRLNYPLVMQFLDHHAIPRERYSEFSVLVP